MTESRAAASRAADESSITVRTATVRGSDTPPARVVQAKPPATSASVPSTVREARRSRQPWRRVTP